ITDEWSEQTQLRQRHAETHDQYERGHDQGAPTWMPHRRRRQTQQQRNDRDDVKARHDGRGAPSPPSDGGEGRGEEERLLRSQRPKSTVSLRKNRIAPLPAPASQGEGEESEAALNVAQICNLLYRRIEFCRAFELPNDAAALSASQNAILRYSRLQICATALQVTVARGISLFPHAATA